MGGPIDEVEQSLSSPQMDAEVEAEISAVRQTAVRPLVSADDDAVEAAIAVARRRNGGSAAAPVAATAALRVDRFCGRCGQALRAG